MPKDTQQTSTVCYFLILKLTLHAIILGTHYLRASSVQSQENYCGCRTRTPAIIKTLIVTIIGCAGYYEAACARLGHDPLREDANGEALWEVVHNSKKSIGAILMDQTIIAGVGNIFRAEILFKVPSSRLVDADRSACMSDEVVVVVGIVLL